ncbi:melanoma-derived growth regulatory protein isoform X1 [Zalophus californianus]|uniref:Melanoma-derived growth regulatory protein isoform X1 n=1 Tax=Zalophus californianus TaxID=9704 RepID=A0A6P9FGT3_ZALCA|nr:melanoma-derived growth regulatory protein isoform X1 [Zalophus californianus]
MMAGLPVFLGVVLLSAFPGPSVGGRAMPKLADRKLCADEECSYPISMAVALQDYVAPDCRFLTIHRGQVVYVFSKLKGRGRLFWGGSYQALFQTLKIQQRMIPFILKEGDEPSKGSGRLLWRFSCSPGLFPQ